MEERDETLSATTVSDISVLKSLFVCFCCKSKYVLDERHLLLPSTPRKITFSRQFTAYATLERIARNIGNLTSVVTVLCQTPYISRAALKTYLPDTYTNITEVTCGGMSRVYSAVVHGVDVIVKVTDCSRGIGTKEVEAYIDLREKGVDVANILRAIKRGKTHILVMKRYQFTLSSVLVALLKHPDCYIERYLGDLLHNVKHVLCQLQSAGLTYGDFSPDNIMCDDHGQLLLIDPQFCVPTSKLAKKVGHLWARNIDRVLFAFKVRALAMSMNTAGMRYISDLVCDDFLGRRPTDGETRKFLLKVLPDALRMASRLM